MRVSNPEMPDKGWRYGSDCTSSKATKGRLVVRFEVTGIPNAESDKSDPSC